MRTPTTKMEERDKAIRQSVKDALSHFGINNFILIGEDNGHIFQGNNVENSELMAFIAKAYMEGLPVLVGIYEE